MFLSIQVNEEKGIAIALTWDIKINKVKDDKTKGVYFIRTNYENPKEKPFLRIYHTALLLELYQNN